MSSQYEEDQIIAEFFGDYVGTFLDLGAGDGQLCSNTEELAKRGWSGVCVEPHAESFSALRKFYKGNGRVQLVQAAVDSEPGLMKFFHHHEQLSTGVEWLACNKEWYWVVAITPFQIWNLTGWEDGEHKQFDFVSLDCEGMDQDIAEEACDLFENAKLLCYEHDLPCHASNRQYTQRWNSLLGEFGLTKVVGKTKGNTLVTRP